MWGKMLVPIWHLKEYICKGIGSKELSLVESHKLGGFFDKGEHKNVSWEGMVLGGQVQVQMDSWYFEEVW